MAATPKTRTSAEFPLPKTMKAWALGDPGQLILTQKPVPAPKKTEVLVRIDAVAICVTDIDNIYYGPPAMAEGGLPFNKNWTPGLSRAVDWCLQRSNASDWPKSIRSSEVNKI